MKNLPLSSLRALAAVYVSGGVRPAGRLLGVAHSAISHHLKELEAWIGVPLFARHGTRGAIKFTEQGERLGRQCLDTFESLERSVISVRESRRANGLIVATTPSFAVRWLLPRLPQFQEKHSSVEVSIVVDQAPKLPMDEGADISIRMGSRPSVSNSKPLMDDVLFPVVSPNLLSSRPGDSLELSKLPLLHDRDPNTLWSHWQKEFGLSDFNTSQGARFTSSDLVLRAAEQGLGVALARGRLAHDLLMNGSLVRAWKDMEIPLVDAYWVIEGENSGRAAVRIFVDWLYACAASQEEALFDKEAVD
ncbi:MAG: LysR family transcriptional regulator [Rhizobiaceae bacterium]|nr:LysR family transcriptional regulator [Rhizobiaceae bacterium]